MSTGLRSVAVVAAVLIGLLGLAPAFLNAQADGIEWARGGNTTNMPHLAFSSDGEYLVSAGEGALKVWRIEDLQLVNALLLDESLRPISISRDGRFLVLPLRLASEEIELRSFPSGDVLHSFAGNTALVSPDGSEIVLQNEAVLSVHSTGSGELLRSFTTPDPSITYMDFLNDDVLIVTGKDKHIRFYDVNDWSLQTEFDAELGIGCHFAVSADGRYLVTIGQRAIVKVWDLESESELLDIGKHNIDRPSNTCRFLVDFAPDSERFRIIISQTGTRPFYLKSSTAFIYDRSSGDEVGALPYPAASVSYESVGVGFTNDWRYAVNTDASHELILWDFASGAKEDDISELTQPATQLEFSPDGEWIASLAPGTVGADLRIWNAVTGKVKHHVFSNTGRMAFTPDERSYVYSDGDFIEFKSLNSGSLSRSLKPEVGTVGDIAITPGGEFLAAAMENSIDIWEIDSNRIVQTLSPFQDRPDHLRYSPDGQWLACRLQESIVLIDTAMPDQQVELADVVGADGSFAWSPEGKQLAIAPGSLSPMGDISIWDVGSQSEMTTLGGGIGAMRDVAFAPNGRFLVAVGEDQSVIVWNTESEEIVHEYGGYEFREPGFDGEEGYSALAVHPAGTHIATGAIDGSLLAWRSSRVIVGVDDDRQEAGPQFVRAYPNPCDARMSFRWRMDASANVSLKIYDGLGGLVARPYSGMLHSGHQKVDFNTEGLATGTYYYTIELESETLSGVLTVIH